MAINNDIDTFYELLKDIRPGVFQNHQCSILSIDGERTFTSAKSAIKENFSFVGVAENIGASSKMSELGLGFSIDGSIRENASDSKAPELELGSKQKKIPAEAN